MSILTPVRRQLTRSADRHLRALADQWTDASSGHAAVIGRGIKRGMIYQRLREIAMREDAIPGGIIQVPPREKRDEPFSCAMAGFEVDLDALSVGLPAVLAERRALARRWLGG
jgi:hypothetical protein